MSQGLGDKPFCAGIYLSLADIAVGCALGYLDFRFPQIDWRGSLSRTSPSCTKSWHAAPQLRRLDPAGLSSRMKKKAEASRPLFRIKPAMKEKCCEARP
jgi:glutathione S-transferase